MPPPLNGKIVKSLLVATEAAVPNKNTLYALPFTGVAQTLWCNMKLLRPAHLTCPTTWNVMFADAAKLTISAKGQYGLTLFSGADSLPQLTSNIVSYAGLRSFFTPQGKSTLGSPRVVSFVKRWASLYQKHDTPAADVNNSDLQMIAEFDSGKVAMMLHNLGSYQSNVAALGKGNIVGVPLPAGPYNPPGVHTNVAPGNDTYAIFAASQHRAADWKFLQFLLSPLANGYWNAQVGQIPANTGVLHQSWVQHQEPIRVTLQQLASKTTVSIASPDYLPQLSAIWDNLQPTLEEVVQGSLTAKQWVSSYAQQMTKAQALWLHGHK